MGNKVIYIQDAQDTDGDQNLEVYRDISMVSERRIGHTVVPSTSNPSVPVRVQKQFFYAAKDINVKAVFNSIRNIFTWIQGERILNPDFGSKLRFYLYEGITDNNKEQIAAEIQGVCLKWEPRVNIVKVVPVNSTSDQEDNVVRMDIFFTIPSLSDEQYQYSYIYNRTQ